MEGLYDCNSQKNQMKKLSPHTYYKPFTSTFDKEFLFFKFKKKSEEPKWIDRRHMIQPSWRSYNPLVEPHSPCASDDSNNNGSELSVHSKPFFPGYYTERSQLSYDDPPEFSSSATSNANYYNALAEKEQTDLHRLSLSFYNSNLISSIKKHNALLDASSRFNNNQSYSSKFKSFYSSENILPLRQNSLPFKDDLNQSLQNMDDISTTSSDTGFSLSSYSSRRRGKRESSGYAKPKVCNFCRNNKEVPEIYLNHYLHDPVTKVLSCPVLRKHVCEICGETGDSAHTLQYCPVNREKGFVQGGVAISLKTRTITNSAGKLRRD